MTPAQSANFDRLLLPRHIAFIGGRDAIVAIGEAHRRGYAGKIWPVNPKRSEMAGIACFSSIDDLPEAPDAVFLAVPASAAVNVVEALSSMGAGGVVCYTAGFKEAGAGGKDAEARLIKVAGDMALIGPNCYGMINYLDNVALWPFAHGGSCPGYGAAIITQSGMFSSDITMSQRSLPLTHMISAGNQGVLAIEDFIGVLCENPAVRAIGLHIEGLQDVPRFERAALKAMAHNTPVVALKTGNSLIGSALTESHTGSLSGARELYQALFDRVGVIAVQSPAQFLETLKYLCICEAPKGNRVIGFTCSGGGATMLADHSETIGLSYPQFGDSDTSVLRALLPEIATVSNPLDYTTPIWGQPEFTGPVFAEAMARSGGDAAILLQDYPAPDLDESKCLYLADAHVFGSAARNAGIPSAICATIPENMDADTRSELIAAGIAPMQGIHEALNAMAHSIGWAQAKARIDQQPPAPLFIGPRPGEFLLLDEAAGKQLLRQSGIAVPNGFLVNGAGAAEAAAKAGFPAVLKMMGPKLLHKTEAGAVMLGLRDAADVVSAVEKMSIAVTLYDPGAVTDNYLVEQMIDPPLAEMIVSIRHDPQFGFAMMLGSGGILVELVGDAETVLLPASADDMKRAVEQLKLARLLGGFRGRPKADLDLLAASLAGLADFVLCNSDTLVEIEINPLFVYENRVTAVDVLVHTRMT